MFEVCFEQAVSPSKPNSFFLFNYVTRSIQLNGVLQRMEAFGTAEVDNLKSFVEEINQFVLDNFIGKLSGLPNHYVDLRL